DCGINCFNVERTRLGGHIDFFKNAYPHDPKAKFDLAVNYWNNSELSEREKQELAILFFQRQRAGESVVFPSFSGNMRKGEVPKEFLNGNKNIVLFNSSDDEVASFGKSFEYPLFKSQNEGLRTVVHIIGTELPQYNLIIRMHPNLRQVNFPYVQQI